MCSEDNPSEVIVTLSLGKLSMNIKVTNNIESLDDVLKNCIDAAINNQERIRELSKIFEIKQMTTAINKPDNNAKEDSVNQPSPIADDEHYVSKIPNIVEATGKTIKFILKEAYDLQASEAIAILMYALERPMQPSQIADLLTVGWKRIMGNNVRSYLANKKYLKPYVAKTDEGFILTGSGKNWAESAILPKLTPKGE